MLGIPNLSLKFKEGRAVLQLPSVLFAFFATDRAGKVASLVQQTGDRESTYANFVADLQQLGRKKNNSLLNLCGKQS
jgi:hypothetical protein